MAPFAKTGGLADVSAALPKALAARGHEVTCFLPRYGSIAFPPGRFIGSVHVPVDSVHRSAGFYERELGPNLRVIFVEHPPFFDRQGIYGDAKGDFGDNEFRFAFFCRAVIEFCRSRGYRPDVFHAHDWQTGLLPVYLKAFYPDDPTLYRVPTVFTIHNLAYQGHFSAATLGPLGFPDSLDTEAGCDMVLMPSRFEPCGLTQMYSMRYGTIPIVRATGGLADTVQHFDPKRKTGTGFVFEHADGTGLMWAIDEALAAYAKPGAWSMLMQHAMTRDFSWALSAERYEAVYLHGQHSV